MILIGRWSDSRLMSQRPNWIASGMSVAEHLMSCPRLVASTAAELDLRSGLVNPELLGLLTNAVDRFTLEVKVIKSGHPMGPVSPAGRVNSHYFYCAADIYSVNGETVAARPIPAGANLPISGQWRIAQPQTQVGSAGQALLPLSVVRPLVGLRAWQTWDPLPGRRQPGLAQDRLLRAS